MKVKAHYKRIIRKFISPIRRIGLKNRNFSIISNNCWGGFIYDYFGLKYLTPTIGCFFYSLDYLKFINNLSYYLSLECVEIDKTSSKYFQQLKEKNVFVGLIDDIEVIFVHYKSGSDAIRKWNKRAKRVNYDNLIVKFNDQNNFKYEYLKEFDKVMYKNKIFFSGDPNLCSYNFTYYIKQQSDCKYVKDDIKPSLKIFNIKKYINSMKDN